MLIISKNIFEDNRGKSYTFNFDENIKESNITITKAGSKRGFHYHKNTVEYILVISGEIKLYLINLLTSHDKIKNYVLKENEMIKIDPFIFHWSEFDKDTVYINFLNNQFNKKNPDLLTLEEWKKD